MVQLVVPHFPANCCRYRWSSGILPAFGLSTSSSMDELVSGKLNIVTNTGSAVACNGDIAKVWNASQNAWQSSYLGDDSLSHSFQHIWYTNNLNQLNTAASQSYQSSVRSTIQQGVLVQLALSGCVVPHSDSSYGDECVEFWAGSSVSPDQGTYVRPTCPIPSSSSTGPADHLFLLQLVYHNHNHILPTVVSMHGQTVLYQYLVWLILIHQVIYSYPVR